MEKFLRNIFAFGLLASIALGCQPNSEKTSSPNGEWENLLQNNSLDGWHIYQDDGSKKGWFVENGVLIFDAVSSLESGKGDCSLISDKKYTDFEIKLEWKVTPGANSGFMWGVNEDKKYEFPYNTGPEIQIIDPNVYSTEKVKGGTGEESLIESDLENKVHIAGALYDLVSPDTLVTKPAGEWNTSRIIFTREKVSYFLNGIKVIEFVPWSDDWHERRNKGKWADVEDYGKAESGLIGLQDHGSFIWFKNIKIREL